VKESNSVSSSLSEREKSTLCGANSANRNRSVAISGAMMLRRTIRSPQSGRDRSPAGKKERGRNGEDRNGSDDGESNKLVKSKSAKASACPPPPMGGGAPWTPPSFVREGSAGPPPTFGTRNGSGRIPSVPQRDGSGRLPPVLHTGSLPSSSVAFGRNGSVKAPSPNAIRTVSESKNRPSPSPRGLPGGGLFSPREKKEPLEQLRLTTASGHHHMFQKMSSKDDDANNKSSQPSSKSNIFKRNKSWKDANVSFGATVNNAFSRGNSREDRINKINLNAVALSEEAFRANVSELTFKDDNAESSDLCSAPNTSGDRKNNDMSIVQRAGYELKEPIGQGGQSVVFRAVRRGGGGCGSDLEVAIKASMKNKAGDSKSAARKRIECARREAEVLATVHDHRSVLQLLGTFEDDANVYTVCELLVGPDLDKFFASTTITQSQSLIIMRHVLGAVDHMHSFGVAHRDLKFNNVVFVDKDPAPALFDLRVIDLGLVHSTVHSKNAEVVSNAGTYQWMAPEQIRSEPHVATPVDIWAAGVMLYALIESSYPFYARSLEELDHNIHTVDLRERMHRADPDVRDVVLAMLEKDASKRPSSSQAVAMVDNLLHSRGIFITFKADKLEMIQKKSFVRFKPRA